MINCILHKLQVLLVLHYPVSVYHLLSVNKQGHLTTMYADYEIETCKIYIKIRLSTDEVCQVENSICTPIMVYLICNLYN